MHWIGTKEANPSEAPLAMPDDLQNEIVREPAAGEAAAVNSLWLAARGFCAVTAIAAAVPVAVSMAASMREALLFSAARQVM